MINFPVKRVCRSPEECEAAGEQLAAHILEHRLLPCVLLLSGEIGAGKTVFTKGLARGLGIRDLILSPTFPILLEYPSNVSPNASSTSSGSSAPLYHFDLYRLGGPEEFELIGGEDILAGHGNYGPGVSVLEWPERLGSWEETLDCFKIHLNHSGTQRILLADYVPSKSGGDTKKVGHSR